MATLQGGDALVVRGQVMGTYPQTAEETMEDYRQRIDDIASWLLSDIRYGSTLVAVQ